MRDGKYYKLKMQQIENGRKPKKYFLKIFGRI